MAQEEEALSGGVGTSVNYVNFISFDGMSGGMKVLS